MEEGSSYTQAGTNPSGTRAELPAVPEPSYLPHARPSLKSLPVRYINPLIAHTRLRIPCSLL